ncbi:Type-4 uracil-DNA glycosylase [Rubrobacter xylanophilus DSM 9941]|uniref:uracil-DNA glycosylase n=1 Tax=Rubrobacter xylanophilus TaxID=49319 RepID=UPI001C63EA61|nr:uracil-DNA glycosylase [Rubrobacter xylanophilus]QYJ15060.1 Type-4 uracil-DNA glycosylase [Rubrobacter xylanophilus DSM 9941]
MDETWQRLKKNSAERFGEGSVFGEGEPGARLAIIGEAPGRREVELSRPFVGRAGQLLDELLEEAGIDRSEVYVTNVVKVRPTKESGGRLKNRPPRAGEIREGLEVLEEELRVVGPRALVLLGSTPAKALIDRSFTMREGRGRMLDSRLGLPAIATYHPAYLLRVRGVGGGDYDRLRQQVVEDLRTVWERAQSSG